jgi:hypothetical protein
MVERNYDALDATSDPTDDRDCRIRVDEHEQPCASQSANSVRLFPLGANLPLLLGAEVIREDRIAMPLEIREIRRRLKLAPRCNCGPHCQLNS